MMMMIMMMMKTMMMKTMMEFTGWDVPNSRTSKDDP